ncbi:hypothetical protein LTR27_012088 [Elasticomyces elasticus]|nr:hypothetical protein LTR27_012088 [Elasticomyces elasticus]
MFNAESVLSSRLEDPGRIVTLQGDLEQENDIWTHPPSPEVDAAWLGLTKYGNAWATADDLLRAGKNLSITVKFGEEAGLGDDAYPIVSDVKHLVHCLNRIRKDLWFDYYWSSTFPNGVPSELHKRHTAHCFSILVQSLVCNANTDIITYAWYDGYALPLHDFNINRKCGDFDGISDWMGDHVVEPDDVFDYTHKTHDQVTLPMSPSLRAVVEGYDGGADANTG